MPWDGTELHEAVLDDSYSVTSSRVVAGGDSESVIQPRYGDDGTLRYISDRTGWWNLYADSPDGGVTLSPRAAEFADSPWIFGLSSYALCSDGSIVTTWGEDGASHLGVITTLGDLSELSLDWTYLTGLKVKGHTVLCVAGSASEPTAVVEINLLSGESTLVKASRVNEVDPAYLSLPESIEFPTGGGLTAHALFYAPTNRDFSAPRGELPPLIVASHGGPTASTTSVLNYSIQYWTSRGFAVVDVDYGGSTGYGRDYRQRLTGAWGIVDLDDCVNAALYLASSGRADVKRLLIHGGSAGGYTTLCALTFRDTFAAGASYFGVGDLGALASDTHKFESRYLDGLVGAWPEREDIYRERSPIFHTDLLHTPVILFQGAEDAVVPPAQAEAMADALNEKGVPYAYILYEGEQHGFRKAENIIRTSEAELYFYGKVLGFEPADVIAPVEIRNL
jgi:dipeptidyl aminopeptidase/acylaminoacyl peptidase